MESNPARDTGMGRFADLHPERAVLLRHAPPRFIPTDEVSIRRSDAETSIVVPGELEPSWSHGISPRRSEMCGPPPERWQEEIEGIRDRVTISSWSLPGTAIVHETYDRRGVLSSTVHPPGTTEPAACARTIRCQVTLLKVQIAETVRRQAV